VGTVLVAGLTLSEIETKLGGIYAKDVTTPPVIFVRVLEYKTFDIYITGAVEKPGVYALRNDRMTLAHLLNEAGGILMRDAGGALMRDAGGISGPGAAVIRVIPLEADPAAQPDRPGNSPANAAVSPPYPLTIQDRGGDRVQISFTVTSHLSAVGQLLVKREEQPLLEEWLDLGNEFRRHATLVRLAELDAGVDTREIERRLLVVAGQVAARNQQANALAQGETQAPAGLSTAGSTVVLPVYGLNIPLTNVALREGDSVIVERLRVPMFSVIGLVRSPGNFPYPPDTQYNLMQAVAFAGGLDPVASPRYATVYRLAEDGSVVRVPFRLIKEGELTEAMATPIRPGDVIAIEHTPRTRQNTIINNMVRFNTGLYLTGDDLWSD